MPKPQPRPTPGYTAPQYEVGDLAAMSPEAIVEARLAGQLDAVLGVPPRDVADRLRDGAQLTRADLAGMSPDEINEARAAGALDDLLGTTTPTRDS